MQNVPDSRGHFGQFGGKYVAETLMPALFELERAYKEARRDPKFRAELEQRSREFVGRPTPLYLCENLSAKLGGAKIYLKREDLCHTGAHKVNNTLGQALLAVRMNKSRITAETGAGQHGVATATMAALFRRECEVFMGSVDVERQSLNVFRMKLLGAKVTRVEGGSKSLKDAMNEALRDWIATVRNTYYLIGTAAGPHPYPMIVRDFQSVIGREARRQILKHEGRLPDVLVACVNGGSNAIGLFYPFIKDTGVKLIGVEAAGLGHQRTASCGDDHRGQRRRTARQQNLPAAGRARADSRDAFDRRGPRLSRRRARAFVAQRRGPRRIHFRHRCRSARRAEDALRDRGNHSGARELARGCARNQARAADVARSKS